jgi:hypothetical protein
MKQKDSVCEALEQVFGQFPKHHITILLIVKTFLGKENIFKPTVWNLSLHETTNCWVVESACHVQKYNCQEHIFLTLLGRRRLTGHIFSYE